MKEYLEPKLEVVSFAIEDVLTTSGFELPDETIPWDE